MVASSIIDAIIQFTYKEDHYHLPENPFVQNMLKLLESEDDVDVSFVVGNEQLGCKRFGAHRLILRSNAPILSNFCGDSENTADIFIKDTKPHVFGYILRFVYRGSPPTDANMIKAGREIIDACDLYGVVGLKMAAGGALVRGCIIDIENAADLFQYADAKTCPLLKEYTLSYIAARMRDVIKTESYRNMKQCPRLMEEIMLAVQSTSNLDGRFGGTTSMLSVDKLRENLKKLGLDMDGSREVLTHRLNDSNST